MEEKDIYLLITRYLHNQTSLAENEFLADWIKASEDNEDTFEEIKTVWLVKPQQDKQAHLALLNLKARIQEDRINPVTTKRPGYLAYAACIAGIIIISSGFYFLKNSYKEIVFIRVETGLRQKKELRLEDGTRIVLAPQSSVSYPEHFQADKRVVELEGEAYFEVSKNPHRPFLVRTASLDVKVLGTHFDVNSYKGDNITTVSLLKGKVAVNIVGDGDDYLLKPSEQLIFNRSSRQVYQHNLDSASAIGWMDNTLVFRNERFAEAAGKISKFYGIKIIMADQATEDTRLYGSFKNETLKEVMETIKATGNIDYRIEENKMYLSIRK